MLEKSSKSIWSTSPFKKYLPTTNIGWSNLFLKDCTIWNWPMLEQFVKDGNPWEESHTEAVGKCE